MCCEDKNITTVKEDGALKVDSVTAVRRESIFSIIPYKSSAKRKKQSQHAGKNLNPDIARSHTPQIITKIWIYIPRLNKGI